MKILVIVAHTDVVIVAHTDVVIVELKAKNG